MKKLTLVRHAKSSWKHELIDIERPLKTRGLNDARLISTQIYESGLSPDLILTSDAERAMKTAEIFVNQLNIDVKNLEIRHDLYDFSGESLLNVILNCSESVNNLMIFGHNNAITNFVNVYGSKYIENVPTCGVVMMEFDITNWLQLKKGNTVKTFFPKDFRI